MSNKSHQRSRCYLGNHKDTLHDSLDNVKWRRESHSSLTVNSISQIINKPRLVVLTRCRISTTLQAAHTVFKLLAHGSRTVIGILEVKSLPDVLVLFGSVG